MVDRLAPTVASPFPVYAIGFLLGVWAIVTMTFVSNYVGGRLYGMRCVSYGFVEEG